MQSQNPSLLIIKESQGAAENVSDDSLPDDLQRECFRLHAEFGWKLSDSVDEEEIINNDNCFTLEGNEDGSVESEDVAIENPQKTVLLIRVPMSEKIALPGRCTFVQQTGSMIYGKRRQEQQFLR